MKDQDLSHAQTVVKGFDADLLSKLNCHTGKKFGIKASGNPVFRNQARGSDALTLLVNSEKEEMRAKNTYYKVI
jgi:hypothetical protein